MSRAQMSLTKLAQMVRRQLAEQANEANLPLQAKTPNKALRTMAGVPLPLGLIDRVASLTASVWHDPAPYRGKRNPREVVTASREDGSAELLMARYFVRPGYNRGHSSRFTIPTRPAPQTTTRTPRDRRSN